MSKQQPMVAIVEADTSTVGILAAAEQRELQAAFMAATKQRTLHDIVTEFFLMLAVIDEQDGEVSDELAAKLDELTGTLEQKAETYKAICLALEAEASACERMAQPYIERAKRKRAHRDRLKHRLYEAMLATNTKRIEGPTGGARIQANGVASLELTVPENDIEKHAPDDLIETVRVLKRDQLKARLQAGEVFDFARLVKGSHLRFV